MHPSGEQKEPLESLGVIPARYGSTRFPGKPLAPVAGKPLVQHVWERARRARTLSDVVVATDDERIVRAVEGFGGRARLTSPEHASGTDRLAEVARACPAALYVNIQGDEPLLEPEDLDTLVRGLRDDPAVGMATLAAPLRDPREAEDPDVVKVVCDGAGRALYFSRARIPFPRSPGRGTAGPGGAPAATAPWSRHVGVYAYRREALLEFASWPPTPLERIEGLEQLRMLEHGRAVRVLAARGRYLGVDKPEDVASVETALLAHS